MSRSGRRGARPASRSHPCLERVAAVTLFVLATSPAPASAQFCADCLRWTTRIDLGQQQPGTDRVGRDAGVSTEARPGLVVTMDVSRRVTDRLDIQVGGGVMRLPISERGAAENETRLHFSVSTVHVGVVYHWQRANAVDIFAGPLIAAFTRDVVVNPATGVARSEPGAIGVGLQAGVRVPLSRDSPVSVDATVRWHAWRAPISTSSGSPSIHGCCCWALPFGIDCQISEHHSCRMISRPNFQRPRRRTGGSPSADRPAAIPSARRRHRQGRARHHRKIRGDRRRCPRAGPSFSSAVPSNHCCSRRLRWSIACCPKTPSTASFGSTN